ncbi:MAG: glutamate-5-semialdehyde dehydrogenase [Cyanobacteria bacterium P01_A01_bin.135]
MTSTVDSVIDTARRFAYRLRVASAERRSQGITQLAKCMEARRDDILEANTLDLEASREMAIPALTSSWLKLTPERLSVAVSILHRLAQCPDPLNQVSAASYGGGRLAGQSMPLGVVAMIYESFPELACIMAGFSLRTGNALILKGGGEASHSNQVLADVLQEALQEAELPEFSVQLLPTDAGDVIRELVTANQSINLVIPYGRRSLVNQVVAQATVPVLKTTLGNCYLYWGASGQLGCVQSVIVDSHKSEPDAVNAIEKVLVDQRCDDHALRELLNTLVAEGFALRGDEVMMAKFPELAKVEDAEWTQAYLNRTVAFKMVQDVDDAAGWINRCSSGHADCLITDSYSESRRFTTAIASAMVYINTSPRFRRISAQGYSPFLGMSNDRGHHRGPITLEMLTTLKQVIQGPA